MTPTAVERWEEARPRLLEAAAGLGAERFAVRSSGTAERAAAVVTDSGTLATHASLVAREYGIPAVVGTGNATLRLRDGQAVTVDGSAGTVELDS